MTAHENLSIVFIQGTLVVSNSWHVLDDNSVVWVFTRCVEHRVSLDHIVNNIGLGDLLGSELLVRAEILAIVVTKMVVAGNGCELDTSTDQEVNKSRFHLGLSRLEIISTNKGVVLFSQLNGTWDKCVLWGTVDERSTLEDGSNGKDGRWCNFFVSVFNGLHEVLGSIVDALDELGETLSVGGPLNDDLVQTVLGLEVTGKY
jgi:hypothetical protein